MDETQSVTKSTDPMYSLFSLLLETELLFTTYFIIFRRLTSFVKYLLYIILE